MKIFFRCERCGCEGQFNDMNPFKCFDCGNEYYKALPDPDVLDKDKCSCGSGYEAYWENDGHGIPLCKVCVDCREEKLSKYEPWVLGYYSEEDCGCAIEPEDYY